MLQKLSSKIDDVLDVDDLKVMLPRSRWYNSKEATSMTKRSRQAT